MTGKAIVDEVVAMFERQLATMPEGMRLRGSLDALQHEQLTRVVLSAARNLAHAWQTDDGVCGLCESPCSTAGELAVRSPR